MAKEQVLQDVFLNALCKSRETVSIYLINGIRLQGRIESFDRFVVMVSDTMTRMVYKHAISTIAPLKAADASSGGAAGSDKSQRQ